MKKIICICVGITVVAFGLFTGCASTRGKNTLDKESEIVGSRTPNDSDTSAIKGIVRIEAIQ